MEFFLHGAEKRGKWLTYAVLHRAEWSAYVGSCDLRDTRFLVCNFYRFVLTLIVNGKTRRWRELPAHQGGSGVPRRPRLHPLRFPAVLGRDAGAVAFRSLSLNVHLLWTVSWVTRGTVGRSLRRRQLSTDASFPQKIWWCRGLARSCRSGLFSPARGFPPAQPPASPAQGAVFASQVGVAVGRLRSGRGVGSRLLRAQGPSCPLARRGRPCLRRPVGCAELGGSWSGGRAGTSRNARFVPGHGVGSLGLNDHWPRKKKLDLLYF